MIVLNYLYKNMLYASRIDTIYKTHHNPDHDHLDFHPHYELYYCPKNTRQIVSINGELVKLDMPCIIITHPYTVHLMYPEFSDEKLERYVVYFSKEFLDSFASWIFDKSMFESTAIYVEENNSRLEIIKKIFNRSLNEGQRSACLAEFFASLSGKKAYKTYEVQNSITNVLEYINNNINLPLDGSSIAKKFHMSRATFDRTFKKFVGQSLHKTVIELRLNNAMMLLKESDMTVGKISEACGFESEQYFYSFFRKKLKMTPQHFRKIVRKE